MKLTKSGNALLALAAVIVTAFIILVSITDADQDVEESIPGGTITYYPGDGVHTVEVVENSAGERSLDTSGTATSIVVNTYQGIKSTEYNPEFWRDTGEISGEVKDWQGPAQQVTWDDVSSLELTVKFTGINTGSDSGKYIVTMPAGITIKAVGFGTGSDSSFTEVSYDQKDGKYYFQVIGGAENKVAVVDLTVSYNTTVNINKVFGGWKERSYTLSYSGNGSTSGDMASERTVAYHKYTLPLCKFLKSGYIFAGWSVSGIDGLKYPGDEISVSKDTTITANWLESAYAGSDYCKVSFKNADTNLIDPMFVLKGRQIALPENTASIEGKAFTGWVVGTETKSAGETITVSENTDITAKTEDSAASYQVTLANGIGGTEATIDIRAGNGYELPHCNFTITQKSTFRIWAVEATDGIVSYHYPGEIVHIGGDTLVTAIWFDDVIYPGEVVDWSVTELEAIWVVPNLYIAKSLTIPKDNTWDKKDIGEYCECTLNSANVDRLNVFELKPYRLLLLNTKNSEASNLGTISDDSYHKKTSLDGDTVFTTINYLRHYGSTIRITDIPMGTYRTADPLINTDIGKANRSVTEKYGKAEISFSNVQLHTNDAGGSYDVIIDNVNIRGGSTGKHGDGNDGLYANGNRMILGTGIAMPAAEASDANLTSDQSGSSSIFLTVYGGGKNSITKAVDTKRMVFGRSDSSMENMVNVGTFLIIHSGIYYNIVGGGGNSSNIGSTSVPLSTYLVLKGCIVTDTIVGGSGSSAKNTVGNVYGTTTTPDSLTREVGGTFTYALGLFSCSDYWQDLQSGYIDESVPSGNVRKNIVTSESSVVEGGCSKGHVFGCAHLFVSGKSSVWDVQAGGRTHYTISDYAYLEITGHAEVRRVACGTITDGNNSNSSRNTVNFANIYVGGDARVATVYGAGFDTWCYPNSASMTEGEILVEIAGGTIHDVFGGGYRGSVGTPNSGGVDNTDKLSIRVEMTGGTVLGDVFGGGSGGLNKMKHNTAGAGFQNSNEGQDGNRKSTGRSYVYGNISVDISGGTVNGNVYGGGMSVPVLSYYGNIHDGSATGSLVTSFAANEGDGQGNPCYVAAVLGPVNVCISDDAKVLGSVFGAGKGIVLDSQGNVDKNEYGFNWVLSKNDMMKMYWADFGSTGYGYNETESLTSNYQEYAKVQGTIHLSIENNDHAVEKSVYGGGGYSKVYGNIFVNINSGKVNNDVFTGGLGTLGKTSTTGTRQIYIEGTSKIEGSVYGGSKAGNDKRDGSTVMDCDANVVISSGSIAGSVFGGGLKGETHGSTNVYIGYYLPTLNDSNPVINTSESNTSIEVDSIYAGGNVVTNDTEHIEAYEAILVMGNGKVWIDGTNTMMDVKGAVMASGNSCLTGADDSCETGVYISNFTSKSPLTGIHRTKELTISNSSMTITGRNPITPVAGQTKSLSIYDVDIFKVQNNTTLVLASPIDNVDEINSLYNSGGFTTESSPSNRFVFNTGTTVYIRHIDYNASDESYSFRYGTIKGYIAMTAMNQESYGAYAIAKTSLEGGFSYISDGIYKETETSVSDDSCCWFISGMQKKVLTMELLVDDQSSQTSESFIDLTKFQTDTSIMFTGGAFTKMSNDEKGHPYTFVKPDVTKFENEANLALMLGYNVNDPNVPVLYDPSPHKVNLGHGEEVIEGTYYCKGNVDDDPVSEEYSRLVSNPMESFSSNKSGSFRIYMTLMGKPLDTTSYVGYLLLNFQEVKIITYETVGPGGKIIKATKTLVSNTIEVRVDVYIYGSSGTNENNRFSVEVKTDADKDGKRDGESSTLIPKQYRMADTNVVDVSIAGNNDVTRSSGTGYTLPNNQFAAPVGKVFSSWSVSVGGSNPVEKWPGDYYESSTNDVITPNWIERNNNSYTIEFDAGGGSGVMRPYEAQSGVKYIVPNCNFKFTDKHFDHWVRIGGDNTVLSPGDVLDTTGITGSIKLMAVWSSSSYTITFKSGFNDLLKSEINVASGSKYVLPECNYYQPGGAEVFSHWIIGNTSYLPGKVITVDGPKEATAVWIPSNDAIKKQFTDSNTWVGTVTVSAITNMDNTSGWSYVGNNIQWDLSNDTLRNHDCFVGTLLGNIVANVSFSVNGLKSTTTDELPTIRITFERGGYLAYTDLVVLEKEKFLIVFVDRGIETERYYDENTLLTRQLCENPTGSNFNGWYLDPTVTNRYDYNMRVNSDMDGTRLYARYMYTVTLDNMNGTSYKIYVAQEDQGALLGKEDLPTPTYTGYEFQGWYKDRSLIYNWAYNSDRITEDTTLYAKWIGEEIRVNFWYYDAAGKLVLFGGVDANDNAIPVYPDDEGKYDFDRAYIMNENPKVYASVNYGSTFETEDPWHGNKTMMKVAEESIKFTGVFVRWQVTSPIDEHQYIAVYEDSKVTTKIMYLPTEEDLEPYQGSLWKYYSDIYKNTFPRKGNPVEMLEINLVAETTTVAIDVIMGLKESDKQFSSTIVISDPTEFLIYPYGPDLNNPVDSSNTRYYGDYGHIFTKYVDGSHVYYKNEDDDLRFYKRASDGIWTCIYESQATESTDVGDHYAFIYKLNDAVRNGYVLASWNNDYVSIANSLNPDPNLERELHVWCNEDGYIKRAELISKDVGGTIIETPLLVGSYTVSAKDANANGEIVLKGMDNKNDSDSYTVKLLHYDGTVTPYNDKKAGDVMENIPADTTGPSGKKFAYWMVRDTAVGSTYTVRALDANWTNEIELVAIWKDVYTVNTYNGTEIIATKGTGIEGETIDLGTYSMTDHEFTGWYTSGGLVYGNEYVISDTDCDDKSGKVIKVYARWDNAKESTTKVSLVTKYVDNPAYSTQALPAFSDTADYKHIGWQVITGDDSRVLGSNQYTPIATDADDRNVVVLEAVWERLYSVKIDNEDAVKYVAGEVIDLTSRFSTSEPMIKVSLDYIVKGGSVSSKTVGSTIFTMNYRANWTQLNYTVVLSQPNFGIVDAFLEPRNGVGDVEYITTWGQNFIYGDRITLMYSPQNSTGQFIKWVITGKHYIDSYTNSTATLIVQGDCSISADVSNKSIVDLLLSFDGTTLNAHDYEYTQVLLHDKKTDDYYEAIHTDSLNDREHYSAKVPFGSSYELVLRYGQSSVTHRPLIGFTPYKDYAMVGNISLEPGEYSSFLFDILSSRFVSNINVTEPAPNREICDMSGNQHAAGLPDFKETTIYGKSISETQDTSNGPRIDPASNVVIYEMVEGTANVIAQTAKYVGIEHATLQRLIALGYHINDPRGGTPPVEVTFGANLNYSVFGGYPWYIGGDNNDKGGFLVAQKVNYDKEISSNAILKQDIYLDWTKTGSPADVLVKVEKISSTKQFEVTVKIGDRQIHKQTYNWSESEPYRSISMIDNYDLTLKDCQGGTYIVEDGDTPGEKRMRVTLDDSGTHKVTLQYSLAKYTYDFRTEIPTQPDISYPGISKTKDVELTLGTPIELPTTMEQGGVTSGIVRFTVNPYSAVYTSIDIADGKIIYMPVPSDFDSRRAIVLQADWGEPNNGYSAAFTTKYGMVMQNAGSNAIVGPNLLIPDENNRITIPQIVGADGKILDGWKIWASGSHPGDRTDSTSGVIIPIWKDESTDVYSVVFNSGGGSGSMAPYKAKSGISYIIPNNDFQGPSDKYFLKWKMTIGNNVEDVYPGYVLNTSGTIGEIALEPYWVSGSHYTITLYHGDGSSGDAKTVTLAAGSRYVLPLCEFPIPGNKAFSGWNVNGSLKLPGETIDVNTDLTITAEWASKESVTTKTIRYSYYDDSKIDVTFSSGAYLLPNYMWATPTGKVFAGWNASVSYLQPGETYTVRSTDSTSRMIVFEAVWQNEKIEEQYAVILASQYGHPPATQYCKANTIITLPGFGAQGHIFNGWKLWNGPTMALATLFEASADKATEPLNPKVEFIPFTGLVNMVFVTTIDEFSDGTSRFSYTSQSDRTVAQYWATSVQQMVKDFLHAHSEGEYICTGFSDGTVVFSDPLKEEYADLKIGPGEHIFVAQWNITDDVIFGYTSDSHADVTALMDAASSESIPRDIERHYRVNTEVSINIKLDTGYMIDLESTRGELGYKLIKSFVYGDDGTQYYIQDGRFYQNIDNVWTEVAAPAHYYYMDDYENKYVLNGVSEVYRYEGSEWVPYKLESVAGKDGLFIMKYLTTDKAENQNKIYQMIRAGTFYEGTIVKCKVEGDTYPYEVYRYDGDIKGELLYRITSEGIVKDPDDKEVDPMFFNSTSCTYDDWLILGDVIKTKTYIFSTLLTECDSPALGFFKQGYTYVGSGGDKGLYNAKGTKLIGIGPYKDESKAEYDGGSYAYLLIDGKLVRYVVYSASDDKKIMYSMYDGYLSEYDCIEDNGKYYQGTPFVEKKGDVIVKKYRDNYGNIWATTASGEFYVQDQYVYTFSLTSNSEDYYWIHYDSEDDDEPDVKKRGDSGWEDLSHDIPANYYFKDSYNNYFIGNNLVKGRVAVLYVDGIEYKVNYIDVNNVTKELYRGTYSESSVEYGITKDSSVLKKEGDKWIASDKKVYLDPYGNKEYRNDYSMIMVNAKYNTDHEYIEDNKTYHMSTFGNVYQDWLGSPVELSDRRGYIWTFLLQDDLYLRIHTKPITYNVHFIVNGELVDPLGVFSVSTIDTQGKEYYGTDIPKYKIVAFDGYLGQDIKWYTDANYTNEYTIKGDSRYIKSYAPENFLGRIYQFYAVDNISLYAHLGNYVVNTHSYDDTQEVVQYSLTADNNDNIVLPTNHYEKEGYVFVGWALEDHHGMRFYTYAPGETVNATRFGTSASDPETGVVDLYPFYLSNGATTKYYDGKEYFMKIENDLNNQHDPFGDIDAIAVRYSDQPIESISQSDNAEGVSFKHVTDKTVYYCIEIKTRYNESDNRYGNTVPSHTVTGDSQVEIKRVDAYAIAPTVHLTDNKEGTTEISVDITDIRTLNLAEGDYTIHWATMDGDGNRAMSSSTDTIELSDPGSINTYAWVEFSEKERAYASIDYNLLYIDGTILIYPYDSSKDENVS